MIPLAVMATTRNEYCFKYDENIFKTGKDIKDTDSMANGNLSLLKYFRNKVSLVMNVRTTKITRTNKSMPKKKMRYCLSLASFRFYCLRFSIWALASSRWAVKRVAIYTFTLSFLPGFGKLARYADAHFLQVRPHYHVLLFGGLLMRL